MSVRWWGEGYVWVVWGTTSPMPHASFRASDQPQTLELLSQVAVHESDYRHVHPVTTLNSSRSHDQEGEIRGLSKSVNAKRLQIYWPPEGPTQAQASFLFLDQQHDMPHAQGGSCRVAYYNPAQNVSDTREKSHVRAPPLQCWVWSRLDWAQDVVGPNDESDLLTPQH